MSKQYTADEVTLLSLFAAVSPQTKEAEQRISNIFLQFRDLPQENLDAAGEALKELAKDKYEILKEIYED